MTAARRTALALVWLIVLIGAALLIGERLQISGDLRKFMPSAETPAQKLLLDELGEGPGSRLLLMSLSGADAETLAAQSQRAEWKMSPVTHDEWTRASTLLPSPSWPRTSATCVSAAPRLSKT